MPETLYLRVLISGRVQGVAFRAWTQRRATALGLSGWVRNRADGTVEAVFCGPSDPVNAMLAACRDGPGHARVDAVTVQDHAEFVAPPFTIRPDC